MLSQAYLHKPDAKPGPRSPPTRPPTKLPTNSYPSASIQEQLNPWVADVKMQPVAKTPFASMVFGDDPTLSKEQGSAPLSSTFASNNPPSSSSFVMLPPTEATVAEIQPKPSQGNEDYASLGLSISSQINKGKETGSKNGLSQSIQSQITAAKKAGSPKEKKKKRPKQKKGMKANNNKLNGSKNKKGKKKIKKKKNK